MRFVAQELREYMAQLGFKTVDEMVGRSDLLEARDDIENIDLSRILNNPYTSSKHSHHEKNNEYDFKLNEVKDTTVLYKQLKDALDKHQNKEIDVRVTNIDRSFGTLFGSEITKKYGTSLEEDTSKYATDFTKLQEIMDEKTKLENELQVKYERWEYLNNLAEEIANWSNN